TSTTPLRSPTPTLIPYTTLFRSPPKQNLTTLSSKSGGGDGKEFNMTATAYSANCNGCSGHTATGVNLNANPNKKVEAVDPSVIRSEEHTSELQSRFDLVCRLLLE